jgi:uncharacterized protein Usg
MSDFERQLADYRITTAEILYRMPDHPMLLQTFIWQEHDIFPKFPELRKFLDFWQAKLDGANLTSVMLVVMVFLLWVRVQYSKSVIGPPIRLGSMISVMALVYTVSLLWIWV